MLVVEEGNTWHLKVAKDQILSGSVHTTCSTGMVPQLYDGTVSSSGGFLASCSAQPYQGKVYRLCPLVAAGERSGVLGAT